MEGTALITKFGANSAICCETYALPSEVPNNKGILLHLLNRRTSWPSASNRGTMASYVFSSANISIFIVIPRRQRLSLSEELAKLSISSACSTSD